MHTFTPTRRLALAVAALSACGTLYAQQSPPISIGPGNAPAPASISDNPATDATPGTTDDSSQQAPLSVEDLDTLLAPVALYPDSLLSQVLMASTYPLEVVQANRWLQANATLTGDALADALNQQSWDPSVKSLVNTPSVLQMMDDKLDWTIRLGDAFLAQQADVMNSVQRLRAQAQQAGTLRSTAQQNITYENAYNDGATNPPVPQYIEIQETSPQYVYVPVYDPFVVYGNWRYRTHPWFWHPHNYVPTNGIWFGDRYTCGPAWGYAWGEPDWARHDLDLDPHRHSTLNPRFDSDRYIDQHYRHNRDNDGRDNHDRDKDGRNNNPRGGGDRGLGDRGAPNRDHRDDNNSRVTWRHDPTHRRGVAYPDATTAQRFGRPAQLPNAASPRLPNTVSPNLPNTVSPRLPNTVSPNLPNAASPRLPNASATPDADHRGIAPVRPQDPRRDLPIQNNPRDRNNGTPDNDVNRPDRSNDDRSHDDRSTPDRPHGDHSNTDRPNTPTRGNAPDAGQPRDDRNVHPIRPSDRTTGAGNASDMPPAPVPPKPKPAPEPAPTPPTLPKPTPTQPPAPQDTPRRVVPQPTPPQAPQPQVPQAPQPQVPQPAAPRREAPHDAPRHEAPAAPAPAAPTPPAPTPDAPAAPARGGPHGSAGAPDAPAPAPAAPSNAPAAGPHGGR